MTGGATYRRVDSCRVCSSRRLSRFLSLGDTPLANAFVRPEDRDRPEHRYPLEVRRCADCGLVQLSVVVRPDILFRHYLYASSASLPLLAHFEALAEELVGRLAPPGSLVVEVGSNDGVLLRPLAARGARVLGIEPAANLAALANATGLETWDEFFGEAVARRVTATKGLAKVVVANNVLAHIDDLHDVVRALDVLLDDDGVFVAEFPYLADLVAHVEYDTIYHEHLSYFHLAPLSVLFAAAGLELFSVRRLAVHGGSVRIFVGRRGRHAQDPAVAELLRRESTDGLAADETFERFAGRVAASRDALRDLLEDLRARGRRIGGYGATAKGNTLLNYCGIGPEVVAFIADTTTSKHGLLTPGMRIPVREEEALLQERPDYALLLAWNYADDILRRQAEYLARGGRFIHPIPLARIL